MTHGKMSSSYSLNLSVKPQNISWECQEQNNVGKTNPCKIKKIKKKNFFRKHPKRGETKEEVTVIASSQTLSAKEFVIGQAAPIPIFEEILGYLSPGFIWIFGRRVSKSWKQVIEQFIVRSVFSKGLNEF